MDVPRLATTATQESSQQLTSGHVDQDGGHVLRDHRHHIHIPAQEVRVIADVDELDQEQAIRGSLLQMKRTEKT